MNCRQSGKAYQYSECVHGDKTFLMIVSADVFLAKRLQEPQIVC
jgi:hypothetical protein